jgi:hypothetical protein
MTTEWTIKRDGLGMQMNIGKEIKVEKERGKGR